MLTAAENNVKKRVPARQVPAPITAGAIFSVSIFSRFFSRQARPRC
jgi:hypothetical protein